ncbi:MAG: D-alanyl-D-alanine carboxypeptidase [Hyphomicrobiales bacterium]|nr:D-alanyl-D-alanine carboxypeptidase [Hyphomicrobiales bacterium]
MAFCGLNFRFSRLAQIAAGVCVALSAASLWAPPAEAHRHLRFAHYRHSQGGYEPPFSAIVVDANTGRTLYSVNENDLRHPASITKVMTLYLLFEQLDKGALTLQSQIPISQRAAAQEPSKLGLAPGDTISVDDAIKAIVTRLANDIAVAVAEAIGGDENHFAELMTHKAHELGMSRTVFRNASGLPNDEHITTAHDLAILGRATEERFPRYFRYFSTHEFVYDGEVIGNHNHLLGKVEGLDGIKTGYTRASGFNLLTSVHRDGRSLIAVVMGGHTASARDALMESLIADHIAEASTNHTATMIAQAEPPEPPRAPEPPPAVAPAALPRPAVIAEVRPVPAAKPANGHIEEGDAEDGEDEEDAAPRVAAVLPPAKLAQRLANAPHPAAAPGQPVATVAPPAVAAPAQPEPPAPAPTARVAAYAATPAHKTEATPEALGWVKGPEPANVAAKAQPAAPAPAPATRVASLAPAHAAEPAPAAQGWAKGPAPANAEAKPKAAPAASAARAKEVTEVARDDAPRNDEPARASGRDSWFIQIGATDDAGKANDLLTRAREKERAALADAKPLTEKVKRGEGVFYRARFAGLDSATAESACRSLKRSGFACFATRD